MKFLYVLAAAAMLQGCGFSSRNNELTGQVKKVVHNTPIICDDYVDTDLSLGVLRNGVGSMSTQDVWLNVANSDDEAKLNSAAKTGQLVRIVYDHKRFSFCKDSQNFITKVEVLP